MFIIDLIFNTMFIIDLIFNTNAQGSTNTAEAVQVVIYTQMTIFNRK